MALARSTDDLQSFGRMIWVSGGQGTYCQSRGRFYDFAQNDTENARTDSRFAWNRYGLMKATRDAENLARLLAESEVRQVRHRGSRTTHPNGSRDPNAPATPRQRLFS